MRGVFLLLCVPLLLWSNSYDPALLQIGAKLFPKIALMEKGTQEKLQSTLRLCIVASPPDKESAERLLAMIERQYGDRLSRYNLSVSIVSPKEALDIDNAHGFLLLMEPNANLLETLLVHAHKNQTLTFGFDPLLLQKGAAVSLYIGRSVKPYVNLSALKQVPFTFEYGFLKLSQPY